MDIIQTLAQELDKNPQHVKNVVQLLDEGNTIPFIARYRKELHGAMDDTSLRTLEERLQYLRGLAERRETVKKSISEQGKLTDELAAAIDSAKTLAEVEDLYRPYKQKRRTRATAAREKGLEPLASLLFAQERGCPRPEDAARDFIDPEKGVETLADALQGANDIIAEWISDNAAVRGSLREMLEKRGTLRSLAATEEDSVYRLYYDFEQPLSRLQGHQILAINRGEKEKMLSATVLLDREQALPLLRRAVVNRLCRHGFRQSRRRGRLRPSHLPLARARDARFAHRTGRRGRYRSVCAESEAPFDAAAGQGQGDDGPRPWLPHGLQGRGRGRHG